MQSQENIYDTPEPAPASEWQVNTNPREPLYQPQEDALYAEGYRDQERWDTWLRDGEKLQPKPNARWGMRELLIVLLLLCAFVVAGAIFGLIISWLSWMILTVLVIVGTVVIISNWRVVAVPLPTQTFQISERPTLVIRNARGTVVLRPGEDGIVSVAGDKRASGLGIDLSKMQVICHQQGNTLNIAGNIFWNLFQFGLRSIDLDITIPANCDLKLMNGSGKIIVQGANGNHRLRTGCGRIIISDLQGQIVAQTGSGRIEANNLQGRIDLLTGSGRIDFNNLEGRITMRTGSSRIEGSNVRGQLVAHTGSGRIEVSEAALSGASCLKTGSGSIAFEGSLDPYGDYQMKTGSGRIHVTLPVAVSFRLKASTGSGGVINEFGSAEVGSLPRPRLKLRTGSGGIRIYRTDI